MEDTHAIITALTPGTVAVFGLPPNENSSSIAGAALVPARIQEALHASASNLSAGNGLALDTDPRWRDLMDITATTTAKLLKEILACMIETNDPRAVK